MPITNIQYLDYNDSQSDAIDKLNYNFDEIIEANGGTQGITGPVGDTGPAGSKGPAGNTGATGIRGNRWFVNLTRPSGSYNTVMEGDFWIDSNDGKIYIFNESGTSIDNISSVEYNAPIHNIGGKYLICNSATPYNWVEI